MHIHPYLLSNESEMEFILTSKDFNGKEDSSHDFKMREMFYSRKSNDN